MNWLTAALAFVIAMILFSTIASAVTESVHRVFHLRERGLQLMLRRLFEEQVAPRLAAGAGTVAADAQKHFVVALTRNRAVYAHGWLWWIGYWLAPDRIHTLTPLEFAERLADTDVGKHIAALGGARVDAAVDDLTRHFERMGQDASAFFAQRAQTLSLVVAVAIAFVLNIDPVRLITTLAADPVLAERIVAMGPEPASGGGAGTGGAPDDADVRAAVAAARKTSAELLRSGLPIGARFFPWCDDGGIGDACAELRKLVPADEASYGATFATIRVLKGLWLRWLVFVLLGGLLIGLGGPFWFDAFRKLSALVDVARALKREAPARAAGAAEAVAAVAVTPRTPAAAFRAASTLPSRVVLAPGGRPLQKG